MSAHIVGSEITKLYSLWQNKVKSYHDLFRRSLRPVSYFKPRASRSFLCARSGSSAGVADRRPLGARLHVEGTWREIAIDGAQHIATASSLSSLRDAGVRLAASRRNGENLEHGLGLATGARLDRAEGRLGVVPRSMRRSDTRSGLYHLPGPRGHTVYECPGCGERYLGQRRCEACGIFCSRIGPGGPCPHCAEPVAIQDITDTTQ